MNQARRKKRPKRRSRGGGNFSHGLGMLLAGMVIGGIGTALWMGVRSGDASQIGSGIRQMMENSKRRDAGTAAPGAEAPGAGETAAAEGAQPAKQTKFDFYTVLPEIETVVTAPEPVAPPPKKKPPPPARSAPEKTSRVEERPVRPAVHAREKPRAARSSFYMLQAGSYSSRAEADRMKAQLAMKGLPARIQKVTIQGKGDFYRVRLGPYNDKSQLAEANRRLSREGIRALTLKVSTGG